MTGGEDQPEVTADDLECLATLVVNSSSAYPITILGSPELDIEPDERLEALVEDLLELRNDGVDDADELLDVAKARLSGGAGNASHDTHGADTREQTATSPGAVDLDGTDPGTYPADLVEDGARWLLWQSRDDRKIPRNPQWGYTQDEGYGGWAKAGAKNPRAWFAFAEARRWSEHDDDLELAYYLTAPDRDDWDEDEKYEWVTLGEDVPEEPHVGLLDFDDIRDPPSGDVAPAAAALLQDLADTFCEWSPSGTGAHALGSFRLPDGVDSLSIDLSSKEWPDAELELYPGRRYTTVTGEHIPGSATTTDDIQPIVDELVEDHWGVVEQARASVPPDRPDRLTCDPEKSRDELAAIDTTDDIQDVFDAIQHVRPGDIRLRSTVTNERSDGTTSLDPSWEHSESGTRLAQVGDGWVYRKGMHGLDALQVVALEERIISQPDEYPEGEAFWNAVAALRDRGAHIPEFRSDEGDDTGDHVAAIPSGALNAIDRDELTRCARKRGLKWPDTAEVRDRLQEAVYETLRESATRVVDAPTGAGKSHLVATTPWRDIDEETTGGQPVIQLAPTREARDENREKSQQADATAGVLLGRTDACPVCAGAYDPENVEEDDDRDPLVIPDPELGQTPASAWFDEMCDGRGLAVSAAHARARELVGDLPCSPGETLCRTESQWADKPRIDETNRCPVADHTVSECPDCDTTVRCDDHDPEHTVADCAECTDGSVPSYDVIHATQQFAYVPSLIAETNVVFDEQPDFTVDLSTERVRQAVTAYLRAVDAPVSTWSAFIQLARNSGGEQVHGDVQAEADETADALSQEPDRDWYFTCRDAHALAPALARAIWHAFTDDDGPDANGRRAATVPHEPPRLDGHAGDDDAWNRHWVTVVLDDANEIRTVRDAPDLSLARSVIGLDAWPAHPLWQRNTHPAITIERILDREERTLWRRFERNLWVVQLGDATRPYSGSAAREWFKNGNSARVTELETLHEDFGTRAAVAPKAVESPDQGKNLMAAAMRDAGIDDPVTMHQGEEKSRNDFADEDTLVVDGCIDPGDGPVLDLLAECNLDARPERSETACGDCDGAGCHECNETGKKRAHGRGFVGDDADTAAEILASVRENHTAQSAGRLARHPDDPHDWGMVFLRTNAVPDSLVDLHVSGATWAATPLQHDILEELQDRTTATARELATAVGCSKRYVQRVLGDLEDEDIVQRRRGAGAFGADVYRLLTDAPPTGVVDLADTTTNDHVQDLYTWSFAIAAPSPAVGASRATPKTVVPPCDSDQLSLAAFERGAPPPSPEG